MKILALLALLIATMSAQTSVTYTPFNSFSTTYSNSGVAIGDVAGDAAGDICLLNAAGSKVRIIQNNGLATHPTEFDLTVPATPSSLFLFDVDGDGDLEIVTGNSTTTVSIFNRQGATYPVTSWNLGSNGRVAFADLDGDGLRDIVRGPYYLTAIAPGAFSSTAASLLPISGFPGNGDALPGDFDGDGKIDIAWLVPAPGVGQNAFLQIAKNQTPPGGPIAFGPPTSVDLGADILAVIGSVADMDDDGIDDLVVHGRRFDAASNYDVFVRTVLGQANGTPVLLPAVYFCDLAYTFQPPLIADLDQDGKKDALVRYDYRYLPVLLLDWRNTIRRLRNDGTGRLVNAKEIANTLSAVTSNAPPLRYFALGDLDQDQDLDFVRQGAVSTSQVTGSQSTGRNVDVLLASVDMGVATSITSVVGSTIICPPSSQGVLLDFVVRDVNGQPVAGEEVTFEATSSSASVSASCYPQLTNAAGIARFYFSTTAVAGIANFSASLSNGLSTAFSIEVKPLSLSVVSGDFQTLTFGNGSAPVVFEARDALGNPLENVFLTMSASPLSSSLDLIGPTSVRTDSQGRASIGVAAAFASGAVGVLAMSGSTVAVSATINVTPVLPSILSGGGQAIDFDDGFPLPLRVLVTDSTGTPLVGCPVTFSTQSTTVSPITYLPSPTVVTDANGVASVDIAPVNNASVNPGGSFSIVAQSQYSSTSLSFSVFIRKLTLSRMILTGNLTVSYGHEHGPTALILAVDAPQPAPVSTPFGQIWTTILAPGPALFVADALGQFGAADPGLYANPTFTRTYAIPPSAIGFTFVTQIYGFDPAYYPDLEASIFVSNAPVTTL